ncbi:hypothetical protein TNCV_3951071 [Trichonephila clavipes]|nr:hypothetical protein TNCV_3951071 [Trichonephila clavipes]
MTKEVRNFNNVNFVNVTLLDVNAVTNFHLREKTSPEKHQIYNISGDRFITKTIARLITAAFTVAIENKIDRERQRAGASAQNEWQRGTEANMRKKPKTGEGRGNKRRQSQPGRDVGGAKHETGRNGQNDKRHGRERTEAGAAKEGNKESEQNKISMVHSS